MDRDAMIDHLARRFAAAGRRIGLEPEDLRQEARLALVQHRDTVEGGGPALTYVVARGHLCHLLFSGRRATLAAAAAAPPPCDPAPGPAEEAERNELVAILHEGIAALLDNRREALLAADYSHRGNPDHAAARARLGLPSTTYHHRRKRALADLRRHFGVRP